MENIRSRVKIELVKKNDNENFLKQQSNLFFNLIHLSFTKYDSCTFKQNDVLMDKPIYLGFAVTELSKLLMYESRYDNLQPSFVEKKIQVQYLDTDSFVLSVNTELQTQKRRRVIRFQPFDKKSWTIHYKKQKMIEKYKKETPKIFGLMKFSV